MIIDSVLDQVIQAITEAVWNRPELERLREPIEQTLQANSFKALTRRALSEIESRSELPHFLSEEFIQHDVTQRHLAAYIVQGKDEAIGELASLYARQFGGDAVEIEGYLRAYLKQLRETLAADSTYGPILMARDVQVVVAGIQNLQTDMSDVKQLLRELLQEPELQALVERKQGRHIFLSYTRANLKIAAQIRNALEDAGHIIWQDVTTIKGGEEWIQSIEDGIDRAYALVTVVSHESRESKWVRIEYLQAERRNKHIVPIKIDDCEIPMMMLDLNVVHGHPDLDEGIQNLLAALPPVAEADAVPEPSNAERRQLEIDYLDRILLEHSVWQTVYTPMAGVGQMRVEADNDDEIWEVADTMMDTRFDAFWEERNEPKMHQQETKQEQYDNVLEALEDMQQLVLLGEPGSGKSTSLWRIAADYAQKAKEDESQPLPLIIRLGELTATQSLEAKIQANLGDLAPFYEQLLAEKRIAFLLDGLNEMPTENRKAHSNQIKELVEQCQKDSLIVVVSCRRLDYVGDLDMNISEQVEIAPLDPIRIKQFVNAYITKPVGKGDELFWELAGQSAQRYWGNFINQVEVGEFEHQDIFWLAYVLPYGEEWGDKNWLWWHWVEEREYSRSMLTLAKNPFMLFMMTRVFTHSKKLPDNRGRLFESFVDFLLVEREKLDEIQANSLKEALSNLGYEMQKQGEGTAFNAELIRQYLDTTQVYQAKSANILSGVDSIRFSHQLLQEYFAAKRLEREMQDGTAATDFFPQENWWQPQGWEETAILLAGLYSSNTTPVIEWLRDAQPELTARCILESGAHSPDETIQALQPHWMPRLIDEKEPVLARAATGRAVGLLNLDNREGVGLRADALPDIVWGQAVPRGIYTIGGDEQVYNSLEQQDVTLEYSYKLAKYPVTMAQFQAFLDDTETGFNQDEWWLEFPGRYRKQPMSEQRYKYSNHPRDTVSFYQAVAYCRWLTVKYQEVNLLESNWEIRLPTQIEWEIAARYPDARFYPYGNEENTHKMNVFETGIGQTTAVGIFPSGRNSQLGLFDLSGNVWEWTMSKEEIGRHVIYNGEQSRMGGAFFDYPFDARAAGRFDDLPVGRDDGSGFRCCAAPIGKAI